MGASTTTYGYYTGTHRLQSLSGAQTKSYSFDAAGNMTSDGTTTWTYGGNNRATAAGSTSFTINALGQRVKKAGSATTRFVYDEAGRLWGEYSSSGALVQETVWLDDLPIATLRPNGSGFDLYYVHADQLGTPRAVTRSSDNAIVWRWDNTEAFGNSTPNEDPSGLGAFTYNLRFPGQYYDVETAKHYNYFRDYDPSLGRYIESDPIGLMGGNATYGYVSGQPLKYIDPWGLCQVAVWGYGSIIGWKPCDGGPSPQPRPPQPSPRPSPGSNQCEPARCPPPYDPNIPDVNIPFHREDRFGGTCFANCAIKAGLGFGAKEGGAAAIEPSIAERFGHGAARWCGRASLKVGLVILGNDLNNCKTKCTISTPVLN